MKNDKIKNELHEMRKELEQLKQKNIFQKFKQKSRFIQGMIIGLTITPLIALAGQITKTYNFSPGTSISSFEVNTNFDDLFDKINNMNKGAIVELSSDFTLTCSSGAVTPYGIPFDTIQVSDGNYDSANFEYTIPEDGYYEYIVHLNAAPSPMISYTELIVNGATNFSAGSTLNLNKFIAGDTIKVISYCNDSMNTTETISQTGNYFFIKRVM